MSTSIMGWDIGGAHLKAAVIQQPSNITAIYQYPCPLWKGIDQLIDAVRLISSESMHISRHILTMTGELVDLFENRDDGVKQILTAMRQCLPDHDIIVYSGIQGFLPIDKVNNSHYSAIASANWLASASWAAQYCGSGLFVDIGSTTTDILVLHNTKVMAQGYTDFDRLVSKELIYTGIIRTAVMAVAQTVQIDDKEIGIMAEYFATMADVYRITGDLHELHDQTEPPDGAAKTVAASAKRLARMIGCDFVPTELGYWRAFAHNLRKLQLERIQNACIFQVSRIPLPSHSPLIGAGVGRFLVEELALNLGRPYLDFSDLFSRTANQHSDLTAADCAAAVAVAFLAADNR